MEHRHGKNEYIGFSPQQLQEQFLMAYDLLPTIEEVPELLIDFEKSISNKIQHFPNLPKNDERDILISEILKEIKENL